MAKTVASPEDTKSVLEDFKLDTGIVDKTEAEQKIDDTPADQEPELSAQEADELYAEVTKIDAAIEKLTERKEQIKAAYRRLPYGSHTVHRDSGGKVTIGKNPVFNEAKFLVDFPYDAEEVVDEIVEKQGLVGIRKEIVQVVHYPNRVLYKISPDRTAIRQHLDEETVAGLFDEGTPKVTIR